jgi:hypothetical protein
MYSIKIDLNDSIVDKVMFFLNNIPKSEIKIEELTKNHKNSNLSDFFQNSPLKGEIELDRDIQTYEERIKF